MPRRRTINGGDIFNNLTIIEEIDSRKGKRMFKCLCKCKKETIVSMSNLVTGHTKNCKSCGNTTHGRTKTKLYYTWCNIKQRCLKYENIQYENYGGRGISICDKWLNNFENFELWALNNGYRKGLSIDRINNDGNYEPNNCRWTNQSVQTFNTRKRSDNTSGYTGVFFNIVKKRWFCTIALNGITKHKWCIDKNDAIETRKSWEDELLSMI